MKFVKRRPRRFAESHQQDSRADEQGDEQYRGLDEQSHGAEALLLIRGYIAQKWSYIIAYFSKQ